ncbi:MAG: zinc-ribbon domain-containing protein [Janthinobacterium lividum]
MAARFCSQCGQEVSSAAKFCPNCAAPLGIPVTGPAAPSGLTTHPLDTAARKSRSLLLPAAIVAVIVLAIAVAVLAGKSRQQASLLVSPTAASTSGAAVTNAPTLPPSSGAPLTDAPSLAPTTGTPLTNAPTQAPLNGSGLTNAPDKLAATLPPDVAAYLSFLQRIEEKRVAMNNDVSGAMAMMSVAQGMQGQQTQATDSEADPDKPDSDGGQGAAKQSTQKLSQGYSDYAVKWQALVREFRATPAPASCALLANRYQLFLSDYTTVITKMQVALLNHDSSSLPDLSAVTQVQGQVDTDGTQADSALTDLCARYGVSKPFVISPEGAAPSLLGH